MSWRLLLIALAGFALALPSTGRTHRDTTQALPDSTLEGLSIQENFLRNLDSLMNLWYVQKAVGNSFVAGVEIDSEGIVPELHDSVYIQRLAAIHSAIDLPFNGIVRNFINVYTQRRREQMGVMLGLTDHYFPIFEEALSLYQLPLELRVLPVIESALNPRAVSRVGATGIWQFMYRTGRMYGLTVNSFVDERRDPVASSLAAARFLRDLYAMYNDWHLALAAYNYGPGNVNRAIRRAGGRRCYWEIYKFLPRETRGYVPAFIAATYALTYHREHNIAPVPMNLPPTSDTIMVSGMLHLQQVSEVLGIPMAILRDLNPQYTRDVIPATDRRFALKLPVPYVGEFIDREQEIFAHRDSFFFNPNNVVNPARLAASPSHTPPQGSVRVEYRVREGDVLGTIAQRHNVTVAQIRAWNNLRGNLIRTGQRLVLFPPRATAQRLGHVEPPASQPAGENAEASAEYIIHRVRQGDTLWNIARQYPGVSDADIKRLNNLTNDRLFPGQRLKIKPRG